MILPYVYDPVTQDLWLYENVTVSWTSPTPGSATFKRPYAWNPNSPLYGYRKSLVGITARPRTFSTPNIGVGSPWSDINDPNAAVNQPVYYNSFPFMQWVVSRRFMTVCSHCYGFFADRNPAKTFVGVGALGHYQAGTYLHAVMTQAFRWIDHDDQLLQELDPTLLMAPYKTDLTGYPGMLNVSDTALCESYEDLKATPIQYVDMRSVPANSTVWTIDSNHKIIRGKLETAFVDSRLVETSDYKWVQPDGTPALYDFITFTHDSSSTIMVELSPPSSREAGDGVLGWTPGGLSSSSWLIRDGVGSIATTAPLAANNDLWNYMAYRGYPVAEIALVPRRWRAATERVEQQILDAVEGITLE